MCGEPLPFAASCSILVPRLPASSSLAFFSYFTTYPAHPQAPTLTRASSYYLRIPTLDGFINLYLGLKHRQYALRFMYSAHPSQSPARSQSPSQTSLLLHTQPWRSLHANPTRPRPPLSASQSTLTIPLPGATIARNIPDGGR